MITVFLRAVSRFNSSCLSGYSKNGFSYFTNKSTGHIYLPHRKVASQAKKPDISTKWSAGEVFHNVPTISKDVLLYKNDRQRFFRLLTIFGLTQFIFWNYLATFVQSSFQDIKPDEEIKKSTAKARPFVYRMKEALDFENKYKYGLTLLCTVLGCGLFFIPGMLALRSIYMVVLRKGGEKVTIVTYALFGGKRTLPDLPLDHFSCQQSLGSNKSNIALKVKGRWFYFLLDPEGHFPNPKLFEQTVGLHRMFKMKKKK